MRHLSRLYEGRDRVAETVGAHQWAFNNKCIDSIQEHVTENLWLWHQAAQTMRSCAGVADAEMSYGSIWRFALAKTRRL
jgi:hypothetical protein